MKPARHAGTTTFYYLTDGLGSTMALTDEAGDVDTTWDYDVFGAVRNLTGSQPNDFTFAGEQVDGSTGLQYLRARYYDPAVGRFVSRDPWPGYGRWPKTQNRYTYVYNSPLKLTDPSGFGGIDTQRGLCDQMIAGVGMGCEGGPPPPPATTQSAATALKLAILGLISSVANFANELQQFLDDEGGESEGYEGGIRVIPNPAGGTISMSGHTAKRAIEEGISDEEIIEAYNGGIEVEYRDRDTREHRTGYYDPRTNTFLGEDDSGLVRGAFKPTEGSDYLDTLLPWP